MLRFLADNPYKMKTLRKGASGQEVSTLQNMLRNKGYHLSSDGIFGTQTYVAVCQFQNQAHLTADGVVGPDTWKALIEDTPNSPKTPQTSSIDFDKAAQVLNVDPAAIRAVHQVESAGRNGFLPDGRPMILFEGHIFWAQLKKIGIDPNQHTAGNQDILFPKWDRTFYKGGAAEYDRLERAIHIHHSAALCSASWGMFQIMGFNHKLCRYDTVERYVEAMKKDSDHQFMAFVYFLQNTGIDIALRKLDWAEFARRYNGPGYASNRYDEKLKQAYLTFKNQ